MTMVALHKKTPFYAWHEAHGAALYAKGGWVRPARYEGAVEEHLRVRATGGIFDVHSMGKVTVEGPGAAQLLNHAATNDIAGLKVGAARYTCFCADDGGIIDDVIVYRLSNDRFYLITNTLSRHRVLDFLRGHDSVLLATIIDTTSATAYIAVQGPRSRELLRAVGFDLDLSRRNLQYFAAAELDLHGVPVLLARTGYTGELGYELNFPAEYGMDVWEHLCHTGQPIGISPVGGEAMMTLRLEKGYRSYGSDIDLGVNPLEAGLGWVVDWSKADFAGRQALLEARERGLQRQATYLLAEPGVHLARGDALLNDTGREVGEVTSGLYGPNLEAHVGLAYVESGVEVPGKVHVGGEHGGLVACARRPFFDPDGERVRA